MRGGAWPVAIGRDITTLTPALSRVREREQNLDDQQFLPMQKAGVAQSSPRDTGLFNAVAYCLIASICATMRTFFGKPYCTP